MNPVGFDTTFLSILLNPRSRIPTDPATGEPIAQAKRRAEPLVETLGKERRKIVIPTPVTAELLTAIGPEAQAYLEIVGRSRLFEDAAFDRRCAIEPALLNRGIFSTTDPRSGLEIYQKIKIDSQIVSIFKVAGVETVYSDDEGLRRRARLCGMAAVGTAELPLPPEDKQPQLDFGRADEIPDIDVDPADDSRE